MATRFNMTDDEAAAEIRKLTYQMAGVLEADRLAAIQDLLAEVAKGGAGNVTAAEALKKMTALLKNDLGGKSEARAELALRTVVFRAKAVQKYRSLMNKRAIFPYWEYRARSDGRTRNSHEALNGKLLPAGHPIWQRIFPPWGWGCRCIVIPRRSGDIDRFLEADKGKDPRDQKIWNEEMAAAIEKGMRLPGGESLIGDGLYSSPAASGLEIWTPQELATRYADKPSIQQRFDAYIDKMPKVVKEVRTQLITDREKHEKKFPAVGKALTPNRTTKKLVSETQSIIDQVHGDGELPTIPVDGKPGRGAFGVFVRGTLLKTGEVMSVRIGLKVTKNAAANDLQLMTLAHEIGHFLDFEVLGRKGEMGSENADGLMKVWLDAVEASKAVGEEIPKMKGSADFKEYLLRPREMFARSYAQWIATRSGDARMLSSLKDWRDLYPYTQWADDEFEPIGNALDAIFEEKEWMRPKPKK